MKRILAAALVCGALNGFVTARADDAQVEQHIQALRSGNEQQRLEAALALFDMNPQVKQAVPAWVDAIHSPQAEIRILAVAALARTGFEADGAAAALASRLDDPVEGIRSAALAALETLGPEAETAVVQVAENGSSLARRNAGKLLELLDDRDPPKILVLVGGLKEQDWTTRADRRRGQLEYLSIPELARILRAGEDDTTRYHAISALGRKGPDALPAVAELASTVNDARAAASVRAVAAWTLGQIGHGARPAEDALISALAADPYFAVRAQAAQALGKIGAESDGAVNVLVQGLSADESQLRGACAAALWRLGPRAASAVEPLTQMLAASRKDPFEAYFAVGALGAIGRDAAPAVPQLTAALADTRPDVRHAAAFALGRIGSPAEAAIPALRKALEDEKPKVREAAARALKRIDRGQAVTAR